MRTDAHCKLDNGDIRKYHLALPIGSKHDCRVNFQHIGEGTIYFINNKPYTSLTRLSFYIGIKL